MRLIDTRLPARSVALLAPFFLAACVGNPLDLDFDFRPNAPQTETATADRPQPDDRGIISYDSFQVVVARPGDTVSGVASRIGLGGEELASFNGRQASDVLRDGEVLALPRRVTGGDGGTDIASIARGAIDAADAGPGTAAGPAGQTDGEPVRHRVTRGETAFSVARLYGVSVRALAEWNGLGPDLTVREGQILLIPIVIETEAAPQVAAPGDSIAPPPPSAGTPLPERIETAELPPLEDTGTGATPPAVPQAAPAPAPAPAAPAEPSSRLARPVEGQIIRDFSNGNEGIDIAAAAGTSVRAAGDGTVAAITQDTDQVPILVIRHADGLLTVYANVRNISVSRGDQVSRGQSVAEVGDGDPSFLHFEVRRGFEAVNPGDFLP